MSAWIDTVKICTSAFRILEKEIPPPIQIPYEKHFQWRYDQRTPQIVVVQKLARLIVCLQSVLALLKYGLYQDVGVMFRVLDELSEDIVFMSEAVRTGSVTSLHTRFMDDFFQEEFDNDVPINSTQKRNRVPRNQILAALARLPHNPMNASDAQKLKSAINKAYSGYVHGASGHILEMYDGALPGYWLRGMTGTPLQAAVERTAWDYFHRSLVTCMYAATAFGKQPLVEEMYRFRNSFEEEMGKTEWEPPEEAIRRLKRKKPT